MEARKKEERKLKGGDINGKLQGERELEERKNLKKENFKNMEILLGVGQWKATHVESKEKPNPKPKKTKTLNKIQSSMQGLHYYLELGYH